MVQVILGLLETAVIVSVGFLIKKYVFLEPEMERKKRHIFYVIGLVTVAAVYFTLGKDMAAIAALVLIGVYNFLAREKRRLFGLLLMIPFMGIINGLMVPVILVPPYLMSLSETGTMIYQFSVYAVLAVLLVLFYVKGERWRAWFRENMKNRSLRVSERGLLWLVGIVMMAFVNMGVMRIVTDGESDELAAVSYGPEVVSFIGIASLAGFIMTVTIIVLIMQGNKRSFYHDRLSGMQSGMITFMAEVVENRDDNTGGHIRRTAKYVEMITRELKKKGAYSDILTDRYIEDMIISAPLHDIGKIHIPDAVLNKPGKLTDEEFEIMKTHTTAGEELLTRAREQLGDFEYLDMAVNMAAYHHEKWNGKGYPYGKSGEEIPLCARIMAVADVFDALTSKRCYKAAMPLEKAYSIIREESGTHFDPVVVDAFFAAAEEIEETVNSQ